MSGVRELHDKAMRLAQLAMVARHKRKWDEAEALAREACEYESQAADLVPHEEASEPTRSILYRSAAWLAYDAKEFQKTRCLIATGLAGHPSPRIETELTDLLAKIDKVVGISALVAQGNPVPPPV